MVAAKMWSLFKCFTFVCGILRYLYLSLMSEVLPFGSAFPSIQTTFPLLVTIQLHFSSLNGILMSLILVLEFISFLTYNIHDVIHVEEVVNVYSILYSVPVASLADDLAKGVF